ncbi:hypothetical protein AE932_09915, partial [Xanthomonas arboricola]
MVFWLGAARDGRRPVLSVGVGAGLALGGGGDAGSPATTTASWVGAARAEGRAPRAWYLAKVMRWSLSGA